MWVRVIAAIILLILPTTATAQRRVALVIGNAAYQHAGKLLNTINDATDMAAALKEVGFQVVEGFDLDKSAFDRKVREFRIALIGAEAGVFFYSGHGLQVAGQNYVVPIDAQLNTVAALELEIVRLETVHRMMERLTRTNVLILDASRNNPLVRNLAQAMGPRAAEIGRGLAPVQSGVGTHISFSTEPNKVALDGTGRNSPFTGALIKHMTGSSVDLSSLMLAVRNDVVKATEGRQVPWENSALTDKFHFSLSSGITGTIATPAAPDLISEAAQAWDRVKDSANIAIVEAFVTRYGDTPYAALARDRTEVLKRQAAVAAAAPASGAGAAGLNKQELEQAAQSRSKATRTQKKIEPLEPFEREPPSRLAAKKDEQPQRDGISDRIDRSQQHLEISGLTNEIRELGSKEKKAPQALAENLGTTAAPTSLQTPQRPETRLELNRPVDVVAVEPATGQSEKTHAAEEGKRSKEDKQLAAKAEPAQLTRLADFEAPDTVFLGQPFSVSVFLREDRAAEEHSAQAKLKARPSPDGKVTPEGKLASPIPQDREIWEVDVDLSAPGFVAEQGGWTGRIKVRRHGDSDVARFILTPDRLDSSSGVARWLSARLYHQGRFLGSLSRPLDVREFSSAVTPSTSSTTGSFDQGASPNSGKHANVTSTFNIFPASEVPDLDVLLEYDNPESLGAARLNIRSPHFSELVSAKFTTSPEARALLAHEYMRLVQLGQSVWSREDNASAKQQAIEAARRIGRMVWRDYLPAELKNAILRLEESGKLASIQITSNSPIIPWELVLPERNGAGREPEFLGIAYRLGRWSPRRSLEQLNDPMKHLQLRELHVIAPNYEGKAYLPFQQEEIDNLRPTRGFQAHRGDLATVKRLVTNRIVGIVHFSGQGEHGGVGQGDALYSIHLSDGSVNPQFWGESIRSQGTAHPFFFFNARETGRSPSFGGLVQGWAPTILATGAGGFIGGQWLLHDRSATLFSKGFYDRITGAPVGTEVRVADVLRDVRAQFYATGDPTFLAYAFFGDANLRVAQPAQAAVSATAPRLPAATAPKNLISPAKTQPRPGDGKQDCRRYERCIDSQGFGRDSVLNSEIFAQAKCGPRPSQC